MMVNIINISVDAQLELDASSFNISPEHWDGHYLEDDLTLFSRPIWHKDTAEDSAGSANQLSWRPDSWVLYSARTGCSTTWAGTRPRAPFPRGPSTPTPT